MTLTKDSVLIVSVTLLGLILGSLLFRPYASYGSVAVTNDYSATSTAGNALYGATITGSKKIKTGVGTLGSVVITGATTGVFNVYDATTTDITQRASSMSTSTILLASFPASAAAGTYTFDVGFSNGLYFDLISGTAPTTTVTYR